MIHFLIKGLLRDRSRSIFPLLIVSAGVSLTVLMQAWMTGALGDMIETNARFQSGHLKIITQEYSNKQHQSPVALALGEVDHWLKVLNQNYPSTNWLPRIHFGGLLDIPDEAGETIAQGPVAGLAVDLSPQSPEKEYLNLNKSLVQGKLPTKQGEILVSDSFFEKLNLSLDQSATLISSGMEGGMAVYNFKIVGTVDFGISGLNRGAIIVDFRDAQDALNMTNATTEVLGYFKSGYFQEKEADLMVDRFNQNYLTEKDPFSPIMSNFKNTEIGQYYSYFESVILSVISLFIFIMSVVLWNTGIMSGIRRYGEIGVRLALGESKNHIYVMLLIEAFVLGVIGSVLGTLIGLIPSYYLQEYGLDISEMIKGDTAILMSSVIHTRITPMTFWIGLIPGVFATSLGAMIAGITIYRRETAELFKELEV